ncbi:MerR family transcriptional regulator [Nocardia sp. NBC_01009]|uniref:DNA polymerase III subunit beta family protein n=1 Tax=Nocardia sp. NBC_01009 TaxID=2975996 RepID=UPI00386C4C73|nr:MerR family transcriptional regulator [Nocardia sp. NBC_01009]
MTEFGSEELITIGVLARASGLTPSALRFYDDCGLLVPARVDGATGYRYYRESQCARAVMIRQLRGIAVPLEVISEILAGDVERAARLLDAHVLELRRQAEEAAVVARTIKGTIGDTATRQTSLSAATLAAAIDQVRSAAARTDEIPVLAGVLIEASAGSLTLTATDRYRLSTRTIALSRPAADWSLVVDAGDLASIGSWLREAEEVTVAPATGALVVAAGSIERRCRTIDDSFPDYRAMLAGLAPARTRVLVLRDRLLDMIEGYDGTIIFSVEATVLALSRADGRTARLPVTLTGPGIDLTFAATTLSPAIGAALGPEIMLDIAAPDLPVLVRSATDGDLTTLVMPTAHPNSKGHNV